MRKLILLLTLTSISSIALSQEIDSLTYDLPEINIVEKLKQPGYNGATVTINDDSDVFLSKLNPEKEIKGYRLRIFFDNKQSSREDATKAINEFEKLYPNMNTYLVYEPPYFKVTVGDFITRVEAVSIWGKLLESFPTAFIVTENIPISTFLIEDAELTAEELDNLNLLEKEEEDLL